MASTSGTDDLYHGPHILKSFSPGQNGLHVAAANGTVERVRRFLVQEHHVEGSSSLESKFDVNAVNYNGSTALHLAAARKRDDVVEELLDHNPDVNIRDQEGQTPLSLYVGHPEADIQLVKKFLKHGADPRDLDSGGRNCLHFAACTGSVELVKLLLEPKEHSSSDNLVDIDAVDQEGYTALEFAVYYKHEDVLDELLHHNPNVNIQNRWGNTPLIRCLRSSLRDPQGTTLHVVRKLLQHGADPGIVDSSGENCLHIAAAEGHVELVKVLLDTTVYSSLKKFADINARTGMRTNGVYNSTALHLAAEKKHDDVLKELLNQNPDVDVRDSAKQTPLSLYIRTPTGDAQVVRKLLQHGANPSDLDVRGRNCLHFAACLGSVELVRLLLDPELESGSEKLVDIDAVDAEGYTALDFAIYYQHDCVLDELLQHNPNVNIIQGERRSTPVNRSSRKREGTLYAVKKLLQHGADPGIVDWNGENCLHIAAAEGNVELVRVLLDPTLYRSLEKFVDINARTGIRSTGVSGSSALHLAAEQKHDNVLEELLDHKPDVDIRDSKGQTALCLYTTGRFRIRKDTLKVLKQFLRHGADPRLFNSSMHNCLHVAASLGSVEMVELLLDPMVYLSSEKLVDVNGRDGNSSTALHLAAARRSDEVVVKLLDHNPRVDDLDRQQQTPLSIYTTHKTGSAHVVSRFLHHGADPRHVNSRLQNCLHVAASVGNVELVRVLLDPKMYNNSNEPVDISARDGNSSTALHLAAAHKYDNVLEELLDQDADVNLRDMWGQMPLTLYCNSLIDCNREISGSDLLLDPPARVVRKFLQHGADPRILNTGKQNCLHISTLAGNVEVVKVLLDFEAYSSSSKLVDINARDGNSSTSLHLAAAHQKDEVLEELLDHNPDVNIQDGQQQTALSLYSAHRTGAAHVVRNLLQHGADSRCTNVNKETCLHIAASEGSVEVVRVLLDHMEYHGSSKELVDVNARDKDGSTALHVAIHYDRVDVLEEILNHNPDVSLQDWDGRTPLDLCIEYGKSTTPGVKRLVQYVIDSGSRKTKGGFDGTWKGVKQKASSTSSQGQLTGQISWSSRSSLRHDAFPKGVRSYDEPFDPRHILLIFAEAPKDGALEILFLHQEGMVLLFGLGLPFSKVVLRPNCDVEVREVGEAVWKQSWMSRPKKLRLGSLALVDGRSASVLTDPLLPRESIEISSEFKQPKQSVRHSAATPSVTQFPFSSTATGSRRSGVLADAAEAAECYGVGVEGERYYYATEQSVSNPAVLGQIAKHQMSFYWVTKLLGTLSLKAGGGSRGNDGASSSSTTGLVSHNQHGNPNQTLVDESRNTRTGAGDELQQVTVKIYLDSSSYTFFRPLDQVEFSLDTATGQFVNSSTQEVMVLTNTDICKYKMAPEVTVTFFKQSSRHRINAFKRFKTTLDVNYQIDSNVKDEKQFGWYHDQLRVSFECMESEAVRRETESLDVEVLTKVEYKNPQRTLGSESSSSSFRGTSAEVKGFVGNKYTGGIQGGVQLKQDLTNMTTRTQSKVSSLTIPCLKEANFAIKAVDIGKQLAYEASLYPSIDNFDIWHTEDRSTASLTGMMSRVSLKVQGKWTVVDDGNHGGGICEYQFTCQRDLNLFQKMETSSRKARRFPFLKKGRVVLSFDEEQTTVQQKMLRTFKINHAFSHMDRLEQPEPYEWNISRLAEAPHPIFEIIR